MPSPDLDIRPTVAEALSSRRPVVAVVSSPLSHTLPWPANHAAAAAIQDTVTKEGGVAALVAVWKGRLTIGLDPAEAESLLRDRTARRASRRDLAEAIVKRANAGTTVSAAMAIATQAGIRVVVSGAIGAARQSLDESSHPWDISSDLVELSQTPVAVVCSGVRSVSRVNYATDVLDTFRVPIVGFRTDFFPTFYMSLGSIPVSFRVDSPAEAAGFLTAHWRNDGAGVVVAQPTPIDAAISPDELIPALRAVEDQAERDGVLRKDFSPFMMDKLNRLTGGKVIRAYQAVLAANARLGVQIARELGSRDGAH